MAAPRQLPGAQARRWPRASKAAEVPLRAAWSTGRPDSTARTADRLACWSRPQLPWKVVSAVWTTTRSAPLAARFLVRSGKADSKQITGPTVRSPTGRTARWLPRCRSRVAASVKRVTQPSSGRRGTYSPKGTSRILS
jgi:hypothetical protein